MQIANIALETFGIAVSFLLLICCYVEKPATVKQNSLFAAMLITNISVLLCDLLTWSLKGNPSLTVLLYVLNTLVYALGYVLTALFTFYLVCLVGSKQKTARIINTCVTVLCTAAILLVIVSLFNHMYFSFDNAVYERGSLYWLSQAFPVGILLLDMTFILQNCKKIGFHDTLSLLSYGVLPVVAMLIQIFVYGITLLYIATTLSLLIIYITVHMEQARRLQAQEISLQKANVSVMLSQIQPHFLYNSLSVIQALCETEPHTAAVAMGEFANFLRGNMDALNIVYDIKTTMFRLPTLTLQPIVENAVRYGVTKRESGGTVKISTHETGTHYCITVEDDGVGFDIMQTKDDGRTHIGIANVKNRLHEMCGGTLTVSSTADVGTKAEITIPKKEADV